MSTEAVGPDAAAEHQSAGNKLLREGYHAEAICAYDLALEAAQDDATRGAILCNRSAALLKAHKLDQAAEDASRAVELNPTLVKPRYRQACALSALGRARDALMACDAGLAVAPGNAQLLALRSRCEQEAAEVAAVVATGADLSGAAVASGAAEALAAMELEADAEQPPEDDDEYAMWCQATANRLYGKGEFGQACAWYTHAVAALSRCCGGEGDSSANTERRLATLLSNRAATLLRLGRWSEVVVDCKRAVALDADQVKAYARGSAALMRLGETSESVAMADAALAAAAPSDEATAHRRAELIELPTRELRERLRDLRRSAARRAEEFARSERHGGRRHGGRAPCLAAEAETSTPPGGGSGDAAPIEKGEMVSELIELLASEEREKSGSAYYLASQAHAEAVAMRSRVVEIEQMAQRADWSATREHAAWLAAEYPQHRAVRALQLDALLALRRFSDADALLEEQLHATPEAPELLYARAMLTYIRRGGEAAVAQIADEVPLDEPPHARSAELHTCLQSMLALAEESRNALTMADDVKATELVCAALSVAEGSPAARHSLCLLLARSLAKGSRHVEAVRACDEGLPAAMQAQKALSTSGSGTGASDKRTIGGGGAAVPSDHERLLLRRATSFLTLGQYAEAVADYRSAAALNPHSAQAASGLQEAWRALQAHQKVDSLYAVLGVAADASAEELRKAYHREALKWHPDKHAHADPARQVEAETRFKELAAAWAILSDDATRAAYDDDLQRNGA